MDVKKDLTKTTDFQVNRHFFSVGLLSEESDEKDYWLSRTPEERLEALELMRQILYGYDPLTTRLQRVFEVAQQE